MEKVHEVRRNVWILGGTGFIGTALVNNLSADSRNILHLLVHKNIFFRRLEKFTLVTGGLDNFDLGWFERYPADVVFHLARLAGSGPLRRKLAAYRGEKANKRLIKYFSSLDKPPAIVYVSGSLMYGDQAGNVPADEFTPLNPIAFGRYYERAERPWIRGADTSGLKIQLVRPPWILGPGSWFKVFYWDHFLQTGLVPVYGSGQQLMSLIHVEDLGGMIARVPDMVPDVLNLFAGHPVTQMEFGSKLAEILDTVTENITLEQVRQKFGKAEAEALGSSVPIITRYPELWKTYDFRYPDLEDMLRRTISLLKGEERILPKPPQKRVVKQLVGNP